jgi:hypothetical protein
MGQHQLGATVNVSTAAHIFFRRLKIPRRDSRRASLTFDAVVELRSNPLASPELDGAPVNIIRRTSIPQSHPHAVRARRIVKRVLRILPGLVWLSALIVPGVAAAQSQMPVLHTNQAYIEEVTRESTLDVKDPKAVFAFVFANLPDKVTVYPTENFYYFTFIDNGVPYDGNITLDARNRDEGKVIFAYSEDLEGWRGDTPKVNTILDASAGVQLEKIDRLVYTMTYRGKSVTFRLFDLSNVQPPASALAPTEKFIGPVFDESGVRFFLVFDQKLKVFHFILDETVRVTDQFEPSPRTDRILVGKRTGFGFYRDQLRDRKILIGAYEPNMATNTYFDGPFDQLPDNFIEGNSLRDALIANDPSLKGHIDRFGGLPGGAERLGIDPYWPYRSVSDLYIFDRCATARQNKPSSYYLCFAVEYDRARHPYLLADRPRK